VVSRSCEGPLTRLGGSTALIDAPAAIFLAFCEAPMLRTNVGHFAPTARLLVGLLLINVSLIRALFSSACCGATYGTARSSDRFTGAYKHILLASCFVWLMQAASIGVLIADGLMSPMSFSMARSSPGNFKVVAHALFLAATAAAMPQLTKSMLKLEAAQHVA
jgi:magnesium-transporting ATPase (P-type)